VTEDLVGGAWGGVKLAAIERVRPLASARLWHPVCPSCRRLLRWVKGRGEHGFTCTGASCEARHTLVEASSQRYPLSRPVELALLLAGGNGSGKTELVAQLAVAVSIGLDNPDVAAWVEANGVDPSLIPPKGGLVVMSSLTSALGKLTTRLKVAKYLPPGSTWRNQDGQGEATVVPAGACGDGRIVFKSNDQGRGRFQGFAAALIVLDEEHDRSVYDECLQRLSRFRWRTPEGVTRSGYMLLSMTPLKGLTWVYDEFVDPAKRNTFGRVCWIWGENNPHLDQRARLAAISSSSISDSMRAARDRGTFGNAEGLIYRSWRRDVHVIKGFRPDWRLPGWYAFEGIDFGDRNPFAYALYAYDQNDDRLYRIAEWHKAETLLSEHARQIKQIRREWNVPAEKLFTIADPAQRAQRRLLTYEHGISTIKARKDVQAGIAACQERLRHTAEVEPGFYVFEGCTGFVREIEGYRWLERDVKSDQPEQPFKKDDHAMDEWRYVCMAIRHSGL
jgi:phage terminase large subunit-like protein